MLDYQNSLEQMAAHPQTNSLPSQYATQHGHIQQQTVTDTASGYFYSDPSAPRQPFPINGAPLAALHSVTDIKTPLSVSSQPSALSNYNSAAYYSMKNSMLNATPHGISDILSRPDLQAQLQARLGQGIYYSNCSQVSQPISSISPPCKDSGMNRSLYNWSHGDPTIQTSQAMVWQTKQGKLTVSNGINTSPCQPSQYILISIRLPYLPIQSRRNLT